MKGKKKKKYKQHNILPGFNLTLGFTIFYVSILVLIPLTTIFVNTSSLGFSKFIDIVTTKQVIESYKVSFGTSFIAAIINAFFGLIVAWVLVRYKFFGKKVIDAIVDLPFALPTAVAGIALTSLYIEKGFIGKLFASFGIKIAFTQTGIVIALIFIGLPFVVRTLQPVIESLDKEVEEAATCLGASTFTVFRKVILPELLPALITGFSLSFGRALGEYGSVVFISGNIPMKTEIAPLIIRSKLEQYDYEGATAIAVVLLVTSFLIFFSINIFQWRKAKKYTL